MGDHRKSDTCKRSFVKNRRVLQRVRTSGKTSDYELQRVTTTTSDKTNENKWV